MSTNDDVDRDLAEMIAHVRGIGLNLARLCGWMFLITGLAAWHVGLGAWPVGVLICGLFGGATLMALLFAYGAHTLLGLAKSEGES